MGFFVGTSDSSSGDGFVDAHERLIRRIAYDLHDGPAQAIAAALLHLEVLQATVQDDGFETIDKLRTELKCALDELRDLVGQLGPRALDSEDLVPKLEALIDSCEEAGVRATLVVEGEEVTLSPSAQIAVFRVVQEALANIRKHADASEAVVTVRFSPEETVCMIEDDGIGLPETEGTWEPPADSFGLLGMSERASLLGGEFDAENGPSGGARIIVRIPTWT